MTPLPSLFWVMLLARTDLCTTTANRLNWRGRSLSGASNDRAIVISVCNEPLMRMPVVQHALAVGWPLFIFRHCGTFPGMAQIANAMGIPMAANGTIIHGGDGSGSGSIGNSSKGADMRGRGGAISNHTRDANYGDECGTYAYYLSEYYDQLPETVAFLQADFIRSAPPAGTTKGASSKTAGGRRELRPRQAHRHEVFQDWYMDDRVWSQAKRHGFVALNYIWQSNHGRIKFFP